MSDYKDKYERALTLMKKVKEEIHNQFLNDALREAFPEMADSEDEEIRQEILSVARRALGGNYKTFADMPCHFNKWIAWLERQRKKDNSHTFKIGDYIQRFGNQKSIMRIFDINDVGYCCENIKEHTYQLIAFNSENLYELVELA